MIASGLTKFMKIVCWILKNKKNQFKTSFDIYFNFQNSIRAHVGHRAFATVQIDLYRVVYYDSKWSTKIYEDCMWNYF